MMPLKFTPPLFLCPAFILSAYALVLTSFFFPGNAYAQSTSGGTVINEADQSHIPTSLLVKSTRGLSDAPDLYVPIVLAELNNLEGKGEKEEKAKEKKKDARKELLIDELRRYFDQLDSLSAFFTQITPQGRTLKGTFYLKRPGRLRFNYTDSDDYVVADGKFIYFYDSELESQSHALITQTPAGFLLRNDIFYENDGIEVDRIFETVDPDGTRQIIATVRMAADPDAGSLTLTFHQENNQGHTAVHIKEWIVEDAQKKLTRISLSDIAVNPDLDEELFIYRQHPQGRNSYNR